MPRSQTLVFLSFGCVSFALAPLRGQITHQSMALNTLTCWNGVQGGSIPAGTMLGPSVGLSAPGGGFQTAGGTYTRSNGPQGPVFTASESCSSFSIASPTGTGTNSILWTLQSPVPVTGTLTATGSTQSSGTSGQASITIDVGNNGTNDWTLVVGSNTTVLPVAITGSLAIRINTATSAANGFASLSLNLSFRQTATTESFGAGCGQPLVLTSNQPRVGTSWQLTTSGVDAVSPIAATFFGARGPAVPMSAIGLDAPGCDVHLASALTTISGANVAGAAMVPVTIPNSATLVGIKLSAQSLCLTAANPAGLHSSNGLEGTIGW